MIARDAATDQRAPNSPATTFHVRMAPKEGAFVSQLPWLFAAY